MKRRYVQYTLGQYSLIVRVKCTPRQRRRPLDAHFCLLRREEVSHHDGRIALALTGRFAKFSTSPLANRASISPRLLTSFWIAEENEGQIAEMIDWIVARDLKWSFDVLGERIAGTKTFRTDPAFSFDDHRTAVEFKLIFG